MKNTVVFTAANESISSMLVEWIVSLRRLARYSGEVMVLDYGLSKSSIGLLSRFDAKTVPCKSGNAVVVSRYVDAIPILADRPNCVFAHFDSDIWFQDSIDEIFDVARITPGCLFSADVGWYTQPFLGLNSSIQPAYREKIQRIKTKYGGTIQGGFSCGTGANLATRYAQLRKLLKAKEVKWEYGSDQYAFNLLFDEKNDRADLFEWNGIGSDTFKQNGVWWSKRSFPRKLRAIHVVGMLRGELERRFHYCHKKLFHQALIEAGHVEKKSRHVDQPAFPRSVPNALRFILKLCRRHRGSAVTFGKVKAPVFCIADIGCTDFVFNGCHGREEYWDRLKLSRRDHIAEPQHLYFSRRAVETLSKVSLHYPAALCRKFDDNFIDFMLTMMAVEHGLSIGPIMS